VVTLGVVDLNGKRVNIGLAELSLLTVDVSIGFRVVVFGFNVVTIFSVVSITIESGVITTCCCTGGLISSPVFPNMAGKIKLQWADVSGVSKI
jgi:hypothetical protein